MNNGKICVSVCAETADELIENIKRAAEFADVVEIRFDCLNADHIDLSLSKIKENNLHTPLLATFRPSEQGGSRDLSTEDRQKFWNKIDNRFLFADLEEGAFEFKAGTEKQIASYHDFTGVPESFQEIFDGIRKKHADIIKIAFQASDITDTIPLWKLLKHAKEKNKQIIPIAMGEAGKWTRILGLAYGAFMTYASLETGGETAPGQITASDMIEVFRVKELDETTAIYGTVAGNTNYTMSPYIQNVAFKSLGVNAVFVPLQVQNLGEFMRRMVKTATREIELNFKGFSVTNPHKQTIIEHLDFVDDTAKMMGAVNTVKFEDGKFYGYNTDAAGFIEPLRKKLGYLKDVRAAIIGAGGAARACIYSLKNEQADVTLIARDPKKAASLVNEFNIEFQQLTTDHRLLTTGFDIIVNATPMGTKGEHENEIVTTAEQLDGVKLVYDLVYNPAETLLIRKAKKAGVPHIGGMEMLIGQGAEQFRIWTGQDAPLKEMTDAFTKKLFS